MKAKNILWIVGIILAVAAVAAGIAAFVTRFLTEEDEEYYIDSDEDLADAE